MPSAPGYKNDRYFFRNVEKRCKNCDELVKLNNNRDIDRKNFCSRKCANTFNSLNRETKPYECIECGITFLSKVVAKRCETCRKDSDLQCERSYKMLHNNPEKYFQHALYKKGRRDNLTVDYMLELLDKQGGKCAITNQPLTFMKIHGAGRVSTNASIDQVRAGEGYTKDNIQIVCDIVNRMKLDMDMEELLFWCDSILSNQGG